MCRGMHSLPRRAAARAIVLAAGMACVFAPSAFAQDPGQVGSWGALQTYPVVPVSMGVTPDGKIVAWDQANQPPNFGPVPNNGPAMVLDPATGAITRTNNIAPRTTFCSLIATLPDGRLAVIGGGTDSGGGATSEVQIYDPDSKTFTVAGQMNFRRWYPGGTIDRDGNPIVAGGTSTGIERFNQLTGASTNLNTTFPTNWYPDLVRTPGGNFVIEDVGDNATQGPGRYLLSGTNLSTISNSSNLQTRRRGVRTMIGPYTMFYNSGGTSTQSLVIDASGANPTYTRVADSRFPHMTGQALTLPTGDVLAVGGNSSGNDTKGTPVMTPELYSTASNTWTNMANMARRRTYHSVAALLPDGRVWSAGSSFEEVQEPNGQFFSPPYLFRKDGSGQLATRPTATDAPASVAAGQSFSIATSNPSNIASASMIRMAGTTHQVNAGQSYVKLPVSPTTGRVSMTAPSIDQAPPGYYMVFLVDNQGVPSVAPVVRLDKTAGEAPQVRVTQSSQASTASRAWSAWDGDTTQTSASFSQTSSQSEPFWQVDLGQSRQIARLDVRLRADCCTERDLWVFTSNSPFNSTSVQGLRDQAGVTEHRMLTPSGTIGTSPVGTTARYIRIQDPGTNTQLTLSEVQLVSNQDPTVSLTSPANGASFKAPASISYAADAADADGNVTKVEFFRGSTLVGTDTSSPYTASESGVAAGSYTLKARATDNGGAVVDSSTRSITVANNQNPSVSLTAPSNGQSYSAPASISYSADASDSDGTVSKVEFFRGATLVGTDTSSPYTASESNVGAGNYTLKARATDNDGAVVDSSTRSVSVANNQSPNVNITAPSAGATFTAPASYTFSANASDSDGTVSKVEFFRGSTLVGTDTSSPFSVSESGLGAGTYTLTAKATDDDNAATTSAAVNITVNGPAAAGPVAAYAFDEAQGSSLTDRTGNGHTGAVSGATWNTGGHSGNALRFDGVDDVVTVADHSRLDLTGEFTIESWIKPDTLTGWEMAVMKEAPPGGFSYALYAGTDGTPKPHSWATGGGAFSPSPIPVNAWTHLATTMSNNTMRLYVNGQLVASGPAYPAAPSSGPLRIGANQIWNYEAFDGLIDDVRIYNRALSASEIVADRDTPVSDPPPVDPPPTGPQPVLELKFNDGSGSVARDTSGNAHDGSLSASGATFSPAGHEGGAISLNGSGMVSVPDDGDLDLTSTMTLEAWVKPSSAKAWQTVMMKEAPPWTESYALYATGSGAANANAWVGPNGMDPPGNTPTGQWTHLAFTLSGGVGRIYYDGVQISEVAGMGSASPTNGAFRIGGNTIWGDEGFTGLIDDVRVYSSALTDAEIAAHVPGAAAQRSLPAMSKDAACLKRIKSGRHQIEQGRCKRR